jgi:hypothetical protein
MDGIDGLTFECFDASAPLGHLDESASFRRPHALHPGFP